MLQESFHETPFLRARRVLPWLHLMRTPRIAARVQILFAGFIASFLLMSCHILLQSEANSENLIRETELPTLRRMINSPVETIFDAISPNVSMYETANYLVNQKESSSVWSSGASLLIHLFFGLIICRIACSEFATGTGICLERSALFATKKLSAVMISFLFPVISVAVLYAIVAAMISTENIPVVGSWIAAVLYGVSIPLLFLAFIVMFGFLLGWSFVVAVIACENSDSFDAWSRSFDYLRSRLVAIIIAFTITMALGIFALGCAAEISELVFQTINTLQGELLGLSPEQIVLRSDVTFSQEAVGYEQLWRTLWSNLLYGYFISLYWCTISGIYILTRHSVDRTPLNEFSSD